MSSHVQGKRMYQAITTSVVLAVCLTCTAASAETIPRALQDFGLVGTWAIDCSKDPHTQAGYRTIFAAPAVGPVTNTSMIRQANGRTIFMRSEIEAAVRLPERKIQLTTKFIDLKVDNEDVPRLGIYASRLLVTHEKSGSKIHLIDSRSSDGQYVNAQDGRFSDGTATPPLERCVDWRPTPLAAFSSSDHRAECAWRIARRDRLAPQTSGMLRVHALPLYKSAQAAPADIASNSGIANQVFMFAHQPGPCAGLFALCNASARAQAFGALGFRFRMCGIMPALSGLNPRGNSVRSS